MNDTCQLNFIVLTRDFTFLSGHQSLGTGKVIANRYQTLACFQLIKNIYVNNSFEAAFIALATAKKVVIEN